MKPQSITWRMLLFGTFLISALLAGGTSDAGTTPTPLLEYNFNEGSGTTALNTGSVAGSNGGVSNATYSVDTPSGSGSSLHFDGDTDFMEIPDTFDYGSAVTVEAWIKPSAKDGLRILYDDYGNPGVLFAIVNGRLQFNVSTASHPGLGVSVVAGSVCLGQWQHVAGVYDGSTLQAFINGVQVGIVSNVTGAISDNSSSATHVGAESASPSVLEFAGNMDDLRVFGVALTAGELGGGLATNGITCTPADLRLTKLDSPDPVTTGSNITYTLTVTNAGPGDASNVLLTDTLPASTTFVSASVASSNAGQVVTCDLGSLLAGASTNIDIIATATAAGVITNSATVLADEPDTVSNQSATAITTVEPGSSPGTDLTVELTSSSPTCGPDPANKKEICTVTGTLTFRNAGVPYIVADYTLTKTCKLPPKSGCKMTACLTLTTLDLTALTDHDIQFYLSDDAVLDGLDTPLIKKLVPTTALLKAFGKDKAVCPKFKLASGTDPAGKFLIIVVDDGDAIVESNDSNNTAVYGPLP